MILRPGPYACAEWEMGGVPWWLLKKATSSSVRATPSYLEPARRYLKEVGRVLGSLADHPGRSHPDGAGGERIRFLRQRRRYMGELRQALVEAGFDVPLFACNPTYMLGKGSRTDLFHVVNFGCDPARGSRPCARSCPQGPLMCGEFYPGWFDTWGDPHHRGNLGNYLRDLETMLKRNASFSIYMAHGGTTFGLWAGCDRPFKPDTSSYDYDAPISEAGWATEKFQHAANCSPATFCPAKPFPEPPAPNPVIGFAPVRATAAAPVFDQPAGAHRG